MLGVVAATALFTTALGVSASTANARELAEGVSCEGFTCRNDTDVAYRVESMVTCWAPTGVPAMSTAAATTYVRAHDTARVIAVCPTVIMPGEFEQQLPMLQPDGGFATQPPVWKPGRVVAGLPYSADHISATVAK
ncbi:hypothetical protein ACFVUS_28570 [Nocardia sp. NPDC058058]|uniref:hypothetical protein n=1 Tax=Nocardia sp. NPDC058058 TaxID=3346317 RepID=UPI0036DA6686